MPDIYSLAAAFLVVINITSFSVFGYDKALSKIHGARRIPEKTLFLLSFLGGAAGMLLGMALFRHKTKHIKFTVIIPLIFAVQFVLLAYFSGNAG